MKTKKKETKLGREWHHVCSKMMSDSVRVSVPRAFLSILTGFFHHASDAMAGDDRPDHGLAMMRQGRGYYREPFYFLYGKLRRAEKRMGQPDIRKAAQLFNQYRELLEKQEHRFQMRMRKKKRRKT